MSTPPRFELAVIGPMSTPRWVITDHKHGNEIVVDVPSDREGALYGLAVRAFVHHLNSLKPMNILTPYLTQAQLAEMLRFQNELNSYIFPNWRSADFSWGRAIWTEAAELLNHVGWKWWKHQEPNFPQAKLELVDIWHFVLCDALIHHGTRAPAALFYAMAKEGGRFNYRGRKLRADEMTLAEMIDCFAGQATDGEIDVALFDEIRAACNLPWGELYSLYVAKNALNVFRQRNGYAAGTYQKVWGGREDNEVLQELLNQPGYSPSFDGLLVDLERTYARLTAGGAA